MDVSSFLSPSLVFPDRLETDGATLLRNLSDSIAATGAVPDADELYQGLIEREEVGSTAMGGGVAIPHCKLGSLKDPVLAVALVPGGVELGAPDGEAVTLLFLVISPAASPAAHLKCLATVSRWIRDDAKVKKIHELRSAQEIFTCLEQNGSP